MKKFNTEYSKKNINEEVNLKGWASKVRNLGGLIFIDLRDRSGIIQLVINPDSSCYSIATKIKSEYVISVKGVISKRSSINKNIETGEIEVIVSSIEILNKSKEIPFEITDSTTALEDTRLKYRYLDLRNPKVRKNIIFRTEVIDFIRKLMKKEDFLEITTPILTASSPEGARDFIVPSRKFKGKFYALPQAPQQFKQLLMCGGFDKYFQIAPCFRDEDARSDRVYGEFYQLDLEMAFAEEKDVLEVGKKIFYEVFSKFGDKKISKDFPIISYKESMKRFGTDKPDLRNSLELIDLTDVFEDTTFRPFRGVQVEGIVVEDIADKSNSWFNELVDFANDIGMPGIGYFKVNEDLSFAGPIDKFLSEDEREDLIKVAKLKPNSVIFFIADRKKAYKFASQIRDELGRKLDLIKDDEYKFCIINDFPMFEYSDEESKYDFMHNPFSMPQVSIEEMDKLDPEEILAYQYDFVCNGIEMASGAVRNHDIEIMKKVFEIAGYKESEIEKRFQALYEAFKYGAPPHAGMAPGIDRILMMLLEEDSIRETIAFPLSASGADQLMNAPSEVTELQLRESHIKLR